LAHRFTVKQIAAQAGVGTATVDRVLHGRPGVHAQMRARVRNAIQELEEQLDARLPLGMGMPIDVLMNAPRRFSGAVRQAVTRAAASLRPLRVAPRFHVYEEIAPAAMAGQLRRIVQRGTRGVILKAPDEPSIVAAVNEAVARGIPVVTLVTDLPGSTRHAHVGMDDAAAGRTAAYLLGRFVGNRRGTVIALLGSALFQGEEARERGFRQLLGACFPKLRIHALAGGFGLDRQTRKLVRQVLSEDPEVVAVYSMGGGNHGILDAFEEAGRAPLAFIGHDLDTENRDLLRSGRLDAVVEHDLEADARAALLVVLRHHQQRPLEPPAPSRAVIVTRLNL
jgi:LacI family transcriptional regulator